MSQPNDPKDVKVVHSSVMYTSPKSCKARHNGLIPTKIGGHNVYLAACGYIEPEATHLADFLYPLNGVLPYDMPFNTTATVTSCELKDYGGVPPGWEDFIRSTARRIRKGKRILAWCAGSHGRTGTFGASLIAVMEPEIKDPVAEIRKRHCDHAVESLAQATAVFKLLKKPLPDHYLDEFTPKYKAVTVYKGQMPLRLGQETSPNSITSVGSTSDTHVYDGNVDWWKKHEDAESRGILPSWYMKDVSEEREKELEDIQAATNFLHKSSN